jgi:hypothetical protein
MEEELEISRETIRKIIVEVPGNGRYALSLFLTV